MSYGEGERERLRLKEGLHGGYWWWLNEFKVLVWGRFCSLGWCSEGSGAEKSMSVAKGMSRSLEVL